MPLVPMSVAVGVALSAMVISRIVQERALRKLSTEEKGRLVEAFSGYRMTALLPIAALAFLYVSIGELGATNATTMLAIFVPAAVVFTVVFQLFVYRKLRSLHVDPGYLRVYVINRGLVTLAMALLLLAL